MGLIGALMAIPIAAGIKVLLAERLQARDAAGAGAAAPGDGETGPATRPGPFSCAAATGLGTSRKRPQQACDPDV